MASKFVRASKKQAKLRMVVVGTSGSGKTYSSLNIAKHLGKKVAVIDTERGSASKYADLFEFDVLELEEFSPKSYIEAIKTAESEGYDVIVIDSLSHAWMGKGGALEMADQATKRDQRANSFTAWKSVTPEHNKLFEAILTSKAHIIATMRAKSEYVIDEDDRGRKIPRKIGLAPVQRQDMEYEFDVWAMMNRDHDFIIEKTRVKPLDDKVFRCPGEDVAGILTAWLEDGAPANAIHADTPTPAPDSEWDNKLLKAGGLIDKAQDDEEYTLVRKTLMEWFPKEGTPDEVRQTVAGWLKAKKEELTDASP